jgi:Holliday junction resolvase RusA-like endonuclease
MIRLTIPGKPVTQNDVRRMGHWSAPRKAKRRVAADATYAALSTWGVKPPKLVFPVHVTVEDHCATGNLRDQESCAPSVKAILDALTAYGLWPDDSPAFVASSTYVAPVKTGIDELVITITPADSTGSAAVTPQDRSGAEKRPTTAPPTQRKAPR